MDAVDVARTLLPQSEKGVEPYALRVQGDSMIDAMINDGDIVIMKPAVKANNGDMVAIWLPARDETTLKYFFKEKEGYRLQPANPTMKPIHISKDEPLEIKGKVIMVIRKLGSTAA
jgi:repressor LexA